ncbi:MULTISPECIES: hypothetical protein [unclassified Lactococcus]|uniref:hypothetical protein n=1 Tax=unclassified Lactococcus TaxID=2643510 RepID=UPI0011CA4125|nr:MULTISPECIES: hypothetical protein [unclassified Lactococcus]MQW24016.1 hypothetical protein [Lactococcus sp. dk101]TXK36615.1 hypothetical protein FVP42_11085 [Lactococcus sp. dk310]TXK46927.1 hypothetical protein FVP43_10690 [Lactococcus sp. dk322]
MKKNGKHKHLFACGTALALMIGATGGVLYLSNQTPLYAKALELSTDDSLFGTINGTIPVVKASNNDTSSSSSSSSQASSSSSTANISAAEKENIPDFPPNAFEDFNPNGFYNPHLN